MLFFSKPTHIR
ncbi:hypothetical protein C5167_030330 [Papaver somniferum]|nr:hypothetical protein C5167_030330 [Papaver somniferum]